MKELRLMKGNEALAEGAIRAGADAYFGYPITPQSEVMEYLMAENTEDRTGMVTLQAESELAAINMVYGAAGCGKRSLTSSSSPGVSLMQEGISYLAGAEIPGVIVNVQRGGPGLGTIQPGQSDYHQSVRGGGNGDYRVIVLAPESVQESYDFVADAFDLAFKYRNPAMILTDGAIGQMMEKVEIGEQRPRWTEQEIRTLHDSWATIGKPKHRKPNKLTSLNLQPEEQEERNHILQAKYKQIEASEVRFEDYQTNDAEYLFVAYGLSARLCKKTIQMARDNGLRIGLLRPITLWPFPKTILKNLAARVKGILTVEMSAGQMIDDVRLATEHKVPVEHIGRYGGMISTPDEILEQLLEFTQKIESANPE